jgi:CPA2 family monovalent cation:H+ antiporter-2
MHDFAILRDLVVLVAVAIPVVSLAHRLRVPTVVGFLLTGLTIGPGALGLIQNSQSVSNLAEIGVVLLLFTVGLELSLSRIFKLGRSVLQGGGVQVLGTMAAVALLAMAFEVPARQAVFVGALAALSSTAVVLKILTDRQELDTAHGRIVVAILLFQDLSVVPLMLLAPILAGIGGDVAAALWDTAISFGVVTMLVAGGWLIVPRLLERVARLRNREIFTLCIVFVGLGAAYLTASFGLSLALGAFIAGLVISESEFGVQALSDMLPFRDTFSGIFFISIGMLLDLRFLLEHWALLLGMVAALLVVKAVVGAAATRLLKRSLQVSIVSGLSLAQVGEFSFILATVGVPLGLLRPEAHQMFIGAAVLSMLAAPFVIALARPLAAWTCHVVGKPTVALQAHEAATVSALQDHVIIVGYGVNGRNLARVLKAAAIPYVILEQNGHMVRRCRLAREPVYFGDGTRGEVLRRVGVERARVIVLAISAPAEERRGVAEARHLSSTIRIIVRTRYVAEIEALQGLGADIVIPEEFETSIEIFARVLRLYGVPSNVIERDVEAVRGREYELLRGLSLSDLSLEELKRLGVRAGLDMVEVEHGARAVGQDLVSLGLRRETKVTVIAVVRGGAALYPPEPSFQFQPGDTVVLFGDRDALHRAVRLFVRAKQADAGNN